MCNVAYALRPVGRAVGYFIASRRLKALATVSVAVGITAARATPWESDLESFIRLNQCPVVDTLERIVRSPQQPLNRFIVISMGGQRYVQCRFVDNDLVLMCEASSGWYGPPEGESGFLKVAAPARTALALMGFDTDVPDGNYPVEFSVDGEKDFPEIADFMLQALYIGYGAWSGTELEIHAPLAPPLPTSQSPCTPMA
jgi:hypothetical protein